jgi:hypothetical protein
MSEPETREFKLTGAAADGMTGGRRRRGTRRARQSGGNSGALMQLNADRVPMGGETGQAMMAQIQNALKMVGPAQIQMGGDNKGPLLQLAAVPSIDIAGVNIPKELQAAALTALNEFGPDKRIQQLGGRKGQRGGDGIAGTIQLSSSSAPTLPGNVVTPVVSGISPSQPAPVGGARVELMAPKRRTRIALKAKKMRGGSDSSQEAIAGSKPIVGGAHHTRKARKIHLRVKGVTARLAKAKKAKKQAMSAPISEVKARLESAGVIKKTSKAPEPMLRNMYADLLITKKGL